MKHELASAMRRATELVRAGDPAAATQLIQSSLGGNGIKTSGIRPNGRMRGLRATLAELGARKTGFGGQPKHAVEPSLPEGAVFEHGTFSCAAGQRDYRVYVPNLDGKPCTGMVMMLHGCTQSPVDFANGTGMNRLADAQRLIVVYPAQARGANMQSCWNWFSPADQSRGAGEPAILAGLAEQLGRTHDIPRGATFVAGLSAGAAMAVILGNEYPEIFAAVGAHSGLAHKSAHDVASAFAAMGGGAATARPGASPVPTIVFHGSGDSTVNAANGHQIADHAGAGGAEVLDEGTQNGRAFSRRSVFARDGKAAMEHWLIDGLGHAWSGGDGAGSYTDPKGPDASAEMVRFFRDIAVKGS